MSDHPIIDVLKRIPRGKVATYGQVAQMAGYANGARLVVWTLNSLWKKHDLPWFRVVNAKGRISLPEGDGYELQKSLLEQEGVVFGPDDRIDFKRFRWQADEV